jgi:hypothetical protein
MKRTSGKYSRNQAQVEPPTKEQIDDVENGHSTFIELFVWQDKILAQQTMGHKPGPDSCFHS